MEQASGSFVTGLRAFSAHLPLNSLILLLLLLLFYYCSISSTVVVVVALYLVPAPSETCWFRGMSVGGSFRRV